MKKVDRVVSVQVQQALQTGVLRQAKDKQIEKV